MKVRVSAGAGSSRVEGFSGDCLKVRVKEPAREGRANRELVRLLAAFLEIEEERIKIVKGLKNKTKIILLYLEGAEPAANKLRTLGCPF